MRWELQWLGAAMWAATWVDWSWTAYASGIQARRAYGEFPQKDAPAEEALQVAATSAAPGCGATRAASPTLLLVVPWRVKIDEDRLNQKLLRQSDRLLASHATSPTAAEVASERLRVKVVRTGAGLELHRPDAVLHLSVEGRRGRLTYAFERRPAEVEQSGSPLRQAGAAGAARGNGPDEAAFDGAPQAASAGSVRIARRAVGYGVAAASAEAIEDAIATAVHRVCQAWASWPGKHRRHAQRLANTAAHGEADTPRITPAAAATPA